jgi:hypothetical protein
MSSWKFKIDFSDTVVNAPPPIEGVYKVKVVSTELYESQAGNPRIRVNGQVCEGPQRGCTINEGFNIPKGPDDNVIRFWMQFLISLGHESSDLRKKFTGKLELKPSDIEGREGYCHYTPPTEDGGYPGRRWITRGQALAVMAPAAAVAEAASDTDNSAIDSFLNL